MATVRLALVVGALAASPMILWEAGAFVSPALKPAERDGLKRYGFWALAMPLVGALFGWFVLVPVASRFLFTFGAARAGDALWGMSAWLAFVGGTMGAAALAFELPVVAALLARIGVLTPAFFRERGPHMVVFTFVLAALLTPPDVISQVLLAGPILLLIFASAKLVERIHAGRMAT